VEPVAFEVETLKSEFCISQKRLAVAEERLALVESALQRVQCSYEVVLKRLDAIEVKPSSVGIVADDDEEVFDLACLAHMDKFGF
jgi:hypothetical protein